MATSTARLTAPMILLVSSLVVSALALDISFDSRGLKIDGESKIILSGSIHYPRSTPEVTNVSTSPSPSCTCAASPRTHPS